MYSRDYFFRNSYKFVPLRSRKQTVMFDNLTKYKRIILASNSPRRRELLAAMDVEFDVVVKKDVDESFPSTLDLGNVPEYLAKKKAATYVNELADGETLLITADTVVICEGKILGKPHNAQEAFDMIQRLQGQTHKVVSGVALTTRDSQLSFSDVTDVTMLPLTKEQIEYYINRYKPFDKAGAYGIQEWIGIVAIAHIDGSYHNVMGLPTQCLFEQIKKM